MLGTPSASVLHLRARWLALGRHGYPGGVNRRRTIVPVWLVILIVVLAVLALGGVGYSRY